MENYLDFSIIIISPDKLTEDLKDQMIKLISHGGQVKPALAKVGIHRSKLIGLLIRDDIVLSTCCLKMPLNSYRDGVFNAAQSLAKVDDFIFELGYISTHPDHERKGYCQALLKDFFHHIKAYSFFATTRKNAMVHILKKHAFIESGEIYKNDLRLLIYQPA